MMHSCKIGGIQLQLLRHSPRKRRGMDALTSVYVPPHYSMKLTAVKQCTSA